MRALNPCVLLRRKLLGWNVRFIILASLIQLSAPGFGSAESVAGEGYAGCGSLSIGGAENLPVDKDGQHV